MEGEVASLPSLSGSCELVQSCLSSTSEKSEQKALVRVEQRIIIKFLTAEGVQASEILQRLKNCLEKHVSPELKSSNGVKPPEREEREWRTCHIIVDRKHQSPHPILTELSILISFWNTGEYYSNILLGEVKDNIQSKRKTGGNRISFLQDNSRPHAARKTMESNRKLQWDLLSHPPK